MLIQLFWRWLTLLLLASALSACGGGGGSSGSDNLFTEPSNSSGGSTTDGGTTTTTPTAVTLEISGDLLPSGNETTLTLKAVSASLVPVEGVKMNLSLSGSSTTIIESGTKSYTATTGSNGETTIRLRNTSGEKVTLTANATGDYTGATNISVLFGGKINVLYNTTQAVANGTDVIKVAVSLTDSSNNPISGITVNVSTPDSFATVTEDNTDSVTDSQGKYSASISNTVPQTNALIRVIVGTRVVSEQRVTFTAVSSSSGSGTTVTVDSIDLLIEKNNVVLTEEASVIVIPRDASGSPLKNLSVGVSSDSATATLRLENGTSGKFFVSGNTGTTGSFRVYIANTVVQTVNLKASYTTTTDSTTTTKSSDSAAIVFVTPTTSTDNSATKATTIELKAPVSIPSNATANGTDTITISGTVKNKDGAGIAGKTVTILRSSQSASIQGGTAPVTNSNGVFQLIMTSTVAETFALRAQVDDVVTDPVSITFAAVATTSTRQPSQVTMTASPSSQTVGKTVTLTVAARDSSNALLSNVTIRIIPFSNDIRLSSTTVTTGSTGTATLTATSSVVGTYSLEAETVSTSTVARLTTPVSISFTAATPNVEQLNFSILNNNQPADGTSKITLNVVALDSGGSPVSGAPIVLRSSNVNNGAVVLTPASGKTDANGLFTSAITSSQATDSDKPITVTIEATGSTAQTREALLYFKASSNVNPSSVTLTQTSTSTLLADGQSRVVLTVTPLDNSRTPIAGATVDIISTSANFSDLKIATASGSTNALGQYTTTATTTVAGTYTLVPTATANGVTVTGSPVNVVFNPVPTSTQALQLVLSVENNNQVVGSTTATKLVVLARTENGTPVSGVPVVFSVRNPANNTPDVSGSAIFGTEGFSGTTGASGTFTTTISNSQVGKFTVVVTRKLSDGSLDNSTTSSADVTFKESGDTTVRPSVESLTLLSSSSELGSGSGTTGVLITAVVKNKDNNLVPGVTVSFSASSGEIIPVQITGSTATAGITDASGRAQARLTTEINPNNRTVVVTAKLTNSDGTEKTQTINIEVTGTRLGITGLPTAAQGSKETYTVSIQNSLNVALSNQVLLIKSDANNTLESPQKTDCPSGTTGFCVLTNVNGQAEVAFTATNILTDGTDVIRVSKPGVPKITEASITVRIDDDKFVITPIAPQGRTNTCTAVTVDADNNPNCLIPLGQEQQFQVTWTKSGVAQVSEQLNLSTTRGSLPSNVVTDFAGQALFTLSSGSTPSVGRGAVIVSSSKVNGPSSQFSVEFVATEAARIDVQATTPVIGVNNSGSSTEQTEIIAVVRDSSNNLVKNKEILFTLEDVTGGRITLGSVVTDSFGTAKTIYIAGTTSSAANGVKIKATVADNTAITSQATVTVAKRSAFVSIASGNVVSKSTNGTRYNIPHTVLVTDANGTPIAGSTVTLSIYTNSYYRPIAPQPPAQDNTGGIYVTECINEDVNANGILDPSEDLNQNGQLDPGNVITVDNLTLTTEANGFKDFNVSYAIQYAYWIPQTTITAQVRVEGSESSNVSNFFANCSTDDVSNKSCPQANPFAAMNVNVPNGTAVGITPVGIPDFGSNGCSYPFYLQGPSSS